MDHDAAMAALCSNEWAAGAHAATRGRDEVLKALLPATRTDAGRAAFGAAPRAIAHVATVLRDPLVFHERAGALAMRLLRNLCARSPANQARVREAGAHTLVVACIEKRLDFCDDPRPGEDADSLAVRRVEGDGEHGRLRHPFFGFAVEFLCNFATCNEQNAQLVWSCAFPRLLGELLDCDNPAAASAAAALVHNCIAIVPERMNDVVKIWEQQDGQGSSLTRSLLQNVRNSKDESETPSSFDSFSWSIMVLCRLVSGGLVESAFSAIGPSLTQLTASTDVEFSAHQDTLLHVLDAATSKTAETSADADGSTGLVIPDSSLPFFAELLETALLKQSGDVLRTAASIAGSIILLCPDSVALNRFRMTTVKVAVSILKGIAERSHSTINIPAESTDSRGVYGDSASLTNLRGIMIRAIALACDRYVPAQNSVRNLQGIPGVLSALSYEKDLKANPFLREWAVIAIRNLTLGNTKNSSEIAGYELADVRADPEFLEKAGLEAFMDKEHNRPRLRVKQVEKP